MILKCQNCNKEFIHKGKGSYKRKTCSKKCLYLSVSKAMAGKMPKNLASINANKKGSGNPMWGKHTSLKQKRIASKTSKARWANPTLAKQMLEKMRASQTRDEESPNWKGDKAEYSAIHHWIRKRWGKADRCEFPNCKYPRLNAQGKLMQRPAIYDWANLNQKYLRSRRDDWKMMCHSCHVKYDYDYRKGKRIKF